MSVAPSSTQLRHRPHGHLVQLAFIRWVLSAITGLLLMLTEIVWRHMYVYSRWTVTSCWPVGVPALRKAA